jgi:hypothetical protein
VCTGMGVCVLLFYGLAATMVHRDYSHSFSIGATPGPEVDHRMAMAVGEADVQGVDPGAGAGAGQEPEAPQVVIAMATYKQSWMILSPFVWTLRCSGYTGDIVLLVRPEAVDEPTEWLANWLRDFKVTTVPVK